MLGRRWNTSTQQSEQSVIVGSAHWPMRLVGMWGKRPDGMRVRWPTAPRHAAVLIEPENAPTAHEPRLAHGTLS